MLVNKKTKICVLGLGYVGLPLAIEFSRSFDLIGIDCNKKRVEALKQQIDHTNELTSKDKEQLKYLKISDKIEDALDCNFFIITVPTPILKNKEPDLRFLISACKSVGSILKVNDTVVFESTVFPGCTEEICAPILEDISGLKYNFDFYCGYSPERINPGDKNNRLTNIIKITAGSNENTANYINDIYKEIITAGTHKVSSIAIAEMAKVIENVQRDVNIGLMNEIAIICEKIGINTYEVLSAASTKWNFMNFVPGLVGGHCIGIDPYYLTHKAKLLGYHPELILAGRRINDHMPIEVASRLVKEIAKKRKSFSSCRVLVIGITFKENCPDTRNSKAFEMIKELESYHLRVDAYDPYAESDESLSDLEIITADEPPLGKYDAIVLAVPHTPIIKKGFDYIRAFGAEDCIIFDLKSVFKEIEWTLKL